MNKFDAIVPCFNEGDRIKNVLRVLTKSEYIQDVIVVNDGSTDNTSTQLNDFPEIKAIHFKKNKGKGEAVKAGLSQVTTSAVFLFDADLSGLKEENIKAMYDLYLKNPTSMIVGLREKSAFYIVHWMRKSILPLIAGERILPTEDLIEILEIEGTSEYGLEPHMNNYFKGKRKKIITVLLKGVNDVPKWKKSTYGIVPQIQETISVSRKYLEIYGKKMRDNITNPR